MTAAAAAAAAFATSSINSVFDFLTLPVGGNPCSSSASSGTPDMPEVGVNKTRAEPVDVVAIQRQHRFVDMASQQVCGRGGRVEEVYRKW